MLKREGGWSDSHRDLFWRHCLCFCPHRPGTRLSQRVGRHHGDDVLIVLLESLRAVPGRGPGQGHESGRSIGQQPEQRAAGMLAFAANVNKETDVLDSALKALKGM